jgi:hypothetical protein
MEAVNAMDTALVKDDHAAFAALLANNLVVNNPQKGISISGTTGRRNTAGLISYSSYVRSVEYAGMRCEMVLLMGDERVVPKGDSPMGRWRGANCCASSTVPLPLLTSPCLDLQVAALRPRKIWHAGVRCSLTSVRLVRICQLLIARRLRLVDSSWHRSLWNTCKLRDRSAMESQWCADLLVDAVVQYNATVGTTKATGVIRITGKG